MVDLFVTLSIWDSIMAAGSALMQPLYWAVSGLIVFFHWLFTPLLGADSGWTWTLSIVMLTVTIRTILIPLFVKQINSTGVQRRDGFADQIKNKYPDIEIVDIQYGDGDHLKSADLAKAMITAHPDLAGLYGTNEGSAIGIVNAADELKLEPGALKIIGFDSGKAQIDAIKAGSMAGAITQNPIGIGEQTVQAAVDAINGKQLPAFIDTGFFWYDKTNIDNPEIAAVLYE